MAPNEVAAQIAAHWSVILGACGLAALLAGLLVHLIAQLRIGALREENARLSTLLNAEQEHHEDKLDAYDEARDQLTYAFSSLSSRALNENNEAFLRLAGESLKQFHIRAQGELTAREQAIDGMIAPLRDALERTQEQVRALERERREAHGALREHLAAMAATERELQTETRKLTQSLRRPEVRGRWGELSLRRLVELAGMSAHCDFTEQGTVQGDATTLRPDMIIHLPDERAVVVDVKTPLDAYLTAIEASNEAERRAALHRHARNLRERIRELSAKAYWDQFEHSPDFVVLFIPGEQFFSAAVDADRELFEDALQRKVIVASPTSLIAILRAIAFSWRQLTIIGNADTIRTVGEELYRRLATFTGHLDKVGAGLMSTVEHFNRAVGSLERQVLPGARRFTEMGFQARNPPVRPASVEGAPRQLGDVEPWSLAGNEEGPSATGCTTRPAE